MPRSPVALDLLAALLDVTETSAGVALLLVGVVAVPSHVARLAAGVAHLLPLLLGLLALPGDVAASAAVVARWRGGEEEDGRLKSVNVSGCFSLNATLLL